MHEENYGFSIFLRLKNNFRLALSYIVCIYKVLKLDGGIKINVYDIVASWEFWNILWISFNFRRFKLVKLAAALRDFRYSSQQTRQRNAFITHGLSISKLEAILASM